MSGPTLLVLGGLGSGVSTLMEQLKAYCKGMVVPGREMRKLYSTVGVDITNNLSVGNVSLKVIEVGGSMLSLAHRQIENNDLSGVLFVVDPTQPAELPTSVVELYNLLSNEKLKAKGVPFLVVISKQDAPSRMAEETLLTSLGMADLADEFDVTLVSASGVTGTGVNEVFDWIDRKVIH